MGNYKCKYCGCPYDYYTNIKHAKRNSCLVSKDKYHVFQISYINKLEDMIEGLKKSCKN